LLEHGGDVGGLGSPVDVVVARTREIILHRWGGRGD
jgi:hypothetical protein